MGAAELMAQALRTALKFACAGGATVAEANDIRQALAAWEAEKAQAELGFSDPSSMMATKQDDRPGITIYDLGPSRNPDSAITRKLIEMGWTPPLGTHAAPPTAPSQQPKEQTGNG